LVLEHRLRSYAWGSHIRRIGPAASSLSSVSPSSRFDKNNGNKRSWETSVQPPDIHPFLIALWLAQFTTFLSCPNTPLKTLESSSRIHRPRPFFSSLTTASYCSSEYILFPRSYHIVRAVFCITTTTPIPFLCHSIFIHTPIHAVFFQFSLFPLSLKGFLPIFLFFS